MQVVVHLWMGRFNKFDEGNIVNKAHPFSRFLSAIKESLTKSSPSNSHFLGFGVFNIRGYFESSCGQLARYV